MTYRIHALGGVGAGADRFLAIILTSTAYIIFAITAFAEIGHTINPDNAASG